MNVAGTRSSSVRFADSWASVHFDLLRGLAAFFVLLGHWRNIFFIDYPQLVEHRRLLMVPYIISGVGHQSVVLFFVLSGYFIGGTVFRAVERNQWEWRGYLVRRVVRLWTVLVPALLLCLLWDRLGLHLGHAPALYGGRVPNHIVSEVAPMLAPHVFFGNLFFVQTILTPVFGSDGALWSLANEFWYYMLFPLGVIALWPRTRWVHRLICAALFLVIAWFVRGGILLAFPIWLAGAALFKLPRPQFQPRTAKSLRMAAVLLYLPIFFALARLRMLPGLFQDYLLAGLTFLLLWVTLSATERFEPRAPAVRASRELARFSYTLYAVHIPFLVFTASLALGDSRWSPTPVKLFAGLGIFLAVLLYAYMLAFSTEFRTDAIRRRVEQLLGIQPTSHPLPSNPLSDAANTRPSPAETEPRISTSV